MKHILAIILAVCCNCQSNNFDASSWVKLDTSSSMQYEYDNSVIEIYEHTNNCKATTNDSQKRYFYSPIALLDQNSVVSYYNEVTEQSEMRFRIEMWNNKVQNEVVKYLNEIVGHRQIQSHQVSVLPLEQVLLTSYTPRLSKNYSLSPFWKIYDMSKTLSLYLTCYDQKVCDELANQMRSDPEQFNHLKLLYSLSSHQPSRAKQATISIDSVTSGQLVFSLLRKFEDKQEIFLTANDEKKMLTETATNIRLDTFSEFEVATRSTEYKISDFLKSLLVTSRTTIKTQSDKIWDSVFWNEDNYRPDKSTKALNVIVNKLDKETQKLLADMFQNAKKVKKQSGKLGKSTASSKEKRREEQHRNVNEKGKLEKKNSDEENKNFENQVKILHLYDSNSWADVDRISSIISEKMATDSKSSRRVEISKEEIAKLLQDSRNHVQWDEDKFATKPIQLSRIDLDKFRNSQLFQDLNFSVRYTTAELSAPIKIMKNNLFKEELKATISNTTTSSNTTGPISRV